MGSKCKLGSGCGKPEGRASFVRKQGDVTDSWEYMRTVLGRVGAVAGVVLAGLVCVHAVRFSGSYELEGDESRGLLREFGLATGAQVELMYACEGQVFV